MFTLNEKSDVLRGLPIATLQPNQTIDQPIRFLPKTTREIVGLFHNRIFYCPDIPSQQFCIYVTRRKGTKGARIIRVMRIK